MENIIEQYRKLKDIKIERYRELNNIPQDTSIKQHCLDNIDKIISNLETIRKKIVNNIQLENEDWVSCAEPLESIITPLGSHWYMEKADENENI